MNLGQFYRRCVEAGIQADPRGRAGIAAYLKAEKKSYDKLDGFEKDNYDHERLKNPFTLLCSDQSLET